MTQPIIHVKIAFQDKNASKKRTCEHEFMRFSLDTGTVYLPQIPNQQYMLKSLCRIKTQTEKRICEPDLMLFLLKLSPYKLFQLKCDFP